MMNHAKTQVSGFAMSAAAGVELRPMAEFPSVVAQLDADLAEISARSSVKADTGTPSQLASTKIDEAEVRRRLGGGRG